MTGNLTGNLAGKARLAAGRLTVPACADCDGAARHGAGRDCIAAENWRRGYLAWRGVPMSAG